MTVVMSDLLRPIIRRKAELKTGGEQEVFIESVFSKMICRC